MSEQDLARAFNHAVAAHGSAGNMPEINSLRRQRDSVDIQNLPRIDPGSPLGIMTEQCKRYAAMLPDLGEPTSWQPPKLSLACAT